MKNIRLIVTFMLLVMLNSVFVTADNISNGNSNVDLIVESLDLTANKQQIAITIKNNGSDDVTEAFSVMVKAVSGSTITTSEESIQGLAAGATYTFTADFVMETNEDTLAVDVTVDDKQEIPETDENNNAKHVTFAFTGETEYYQDICLYQEHKEYKDLKEELNDYEDDFYLYKKRLLTSNPDDHYLQAKVAADFAELDEDLRKLRYDVEDLVDDVKDTKNCYSKKHHLLDDLEDLEDKIGELREKIYQVTVSEAVADNEKEQAQEESVKVVILQSGFERPPEPVAMTASTESDWGDIREVAWLFAGILVLLAVIVFLIGLLQKR